MSTAKARKIDGTRQRCVGCGHPRVEHRYERGCTVPSCPCSEYDPPASVKAQLAGTDNEPEDGEDDEAE